MSNLQVRLALPFHAFPKAEQSRSHQRHLQGVIQIHCVGLIGVSRSFEAMIAQQQILPPVQF